MPGAKFNRGIVEPPPSKGADRTADPMSSAPGSATIRGLRNHRHDRRKGCLIGSAGPAGNDIP